jgi:hypothetical protein
MAIPANWAAVDTLRLEDGILVEHWNVIQVKRKPPPAAVRCSANASLLTAARRLTEDVSAPFGARSAIRKADCRIVVRQAAPESLTDLPIDSTSRP